MPSAQAFDFAAKGEIFLDLVIGQDKEAVDDRNGLAGQFHDLLRIQVKIVLMPYRQDQCVAAGESFL